VRKGLYVDRSIGMFDLLTCIAAGYEFPDLPAQILNVKGLGYVWDTFIGALMS
jgi:hypothetical protein